MLINVETYLPAYLLQDSCYGLSHLIIKVWSGGLMSHLCSLLWSWRSGNKKKIQESLKTSSILQERGLLLSTNCYSDNGGQASKKIAIMSICWTISSSLTSVRQIVSRTSINLSKIPQLQHTSSPHANSSKLELLERRSDGQCFALDKKHDIHEATNYSVAVYSVVIFIAVTV